MKHVSILVPKGAIMGSIEGPYKLLTEVNDLAVSMGRQPLFSVHLVGIEKQTPLSNGLFTVTTEWTVYNMDKTDLVIVPASLLRVN
ncbi:MAG: AraC family transcriptional regulator, partial [Sphingobacteriales bacterium]